MEKINSENIHKLVPKAKDYEWIEEINCRKLLERFGNFGDAICYSELIWPRFVSHENGLFLAEKFDISNFNDWLESLNGNLTEVQRVMNHVHLLDLFDEDGHPANEDQLIYFGTLLKQTWNAKARTEFPEFSVVTEFAFDASMDFEEFMVTIHNERTVLPDHRCETGQDNRSSTDQT